MTRKVIAWITAGVLAAFALSVGTAWSLHLGRRSTDLALQLEAERQRNFAELVTNVNAIQGLLGKGLAAGSTTQNMLYMGEVHRRSSLAATNFMALPMPGQLSASTGKFLQQVGDFSYSVARGEAAGRAMDDQQRAELARLQQVSAGLSRELQQIGRQSVRGGFRWVSPAPALWDVVRGRGWTARPRAGTQDQPTKALIPGGIEALGPQMDRLPTLVYDGPFSDHRKKLQPSMGGALVTEADARRIAISFVPNAGAYGVVQTSRRNSTPPVFSFRLTPGGSATAAPQVVVDIDQYGGHLVSWLSNRPPGAPRLNLNQAKEIGLRYLREHGFPGMAATYGEAEDGFATLQFAYRHRGVLAYPDQIKVRVALDNGEVLGVDAMQYLMSHKNRGALEEPAVNRAEAARALNPALKVSRTQLTLIPNEVGDGEALAYEFLGTINGQSYLVYVNAKTGHEERILQLQISNKGTLAL